jgi:hypothetical protein
MIWSLPWQGRWGPRPGEGPDFLVAQALACAMLRRRPPAKAGATDPVPIAGYESGGLRLAGIVPAEKVGTGLNYDSLSSLSLTGREVLVKSKLPKRSRSTLQPGATTTVVSGSSIIIGPGSGPVSAKRLRSGVASSP